MVLGVRALPVPVTVHAVAHELRLAGPGGQAHVDALLVPELAEDLDHGLRLPAQPGEVEVGVVSPAGGHAGAVLVHGEPAEHPQDHATTSGRVDDTPALL